MQRPNILLITTDQQRHDGMSLNGNDVLRTPVMDAWAARGVNFTRAYTTCPSCIAARRTLLTGLHCSNPKHGLPGYKDGQEFFPEFTMPGLLGDAGYQTWLVGKFHVYPQRKRYGFDHMVLSEQMDHRTDSQFFKHNDYTDWLRDRGVKSHPAANGIGANSHVARPFHLDEQYHQTSYLVERAIEFLRIHRDPSCPWFMHLSFWAPHPPYLPPQAYWDRYIGRDDWQPTRAEWCPDMAGRSSVGVSPEANVCPTRRDVDIEAMAGYYGMINHIDDRLCHLIDQGFQRGAAREHEPTWIIFTSDHGEMLGDHWLRHKQVPYEGSTHVPFFLSGRNVDLPAGGRACDRPVGLEDVLPTVCDLAGVEVPGPVDGRSLAPTLRGEDDPIRESIHGEHFGQFANHWIVRGRHKYCWFARTNEEQLFDLEADPRETRDLSADASLLQPFRNQMAELLAGRDDYAWNPASLTPCGNTPPRALYKDYLD